MVKHVNTVQHISVVPKQINHVHRAVIVTRIIFQLDNVYMSRVASKTISCWGGVPAHKELQADGDWLMVSGKAKDRHIDTIALLDLAIRSRNRRKQKGAKNERKE